jgi:hypothetical protein
VVIFLSLWLSILITVVFVFVRVVAVVVVVVVLVGICPCHGRPRSRRGGRSRGLRRGFGRPRRGRGSSSPRPLLSSESPCVDVLVIVSVEPTSSTTLSRSLSRTRSCIAAAIVIAVVFIVIGCRRRGRHHGGGRCAWSIDAMLPKAGSITSNFEQESHHVIQLPFRIRHRYACPISQAYTTLKHTLVRYPFGQLPHLSDRRRHLPPRKRPVKQDIHSSSQAACCTKSPHAASPPTRAVPSCQCPLS